MKKELKGFIIGAILTFAVGVTADSVWQISVQPNSVSVVVNGEKISADNFLYNDTTYLPLRAVSEALGQEVKYDEKTNTAYIGEKGIDKVDTVTTGKYTPTEDIINNEDCIYKKDGTYYVKMRYVDESFHNSGKGYEWGEFIENGAKDGDKIVLTLKKEDSSEPVVITFDVIRGRAVILYDYYVDNILPLIE